MTPISYQKIRTHIFGRIQSGEWELGGLIPGEIALAKEYGCARTTVNRALQALADEGLLIRKRKGGTRVCQTPLRHAKFQIQIIRKQVVASGRAYGHHILHRSVTVPGPDIQERLNLKAKHKALHLQTLHTANTEPFAFEDRWVNLEAIPDILNAPLTDQSANEWLVKTVPFSRGTVEFCAENASEEIANHLRTSINTALFVLKRATWIDAKSITSVRLFYAPGYTLSSEL